MLIVHHVAKICHEANRAICESYGDYSQKSWEEAPDWQRESALKGVEFCIDNPQAPASANHESWMKQKEADGWKYGIVKDADKKEHPCMVPFEELPEFQKAKDHLFKSIVGALSEHVSRQSSNQ